MKLNLKLINSEVVKAKRVQLKSCSAGYTDYCASGDQAFCTDGQTDICTRDNDYCWGSVTDICGTDICDASRKDTD